MALTVVYDACVFYPAPLRGLQTGVFRAPPNELAIRVMSSAVGGAQHHVQDDEDDDGAETATTELPGTETSEQTTNGTLHWEPLVIRPSNIRA